jgi:hypothetical protein
MQVAIPELDEALFPSLLFYRIAQAFRRRIEVPSDELDVGPTVQATARHGGWLMPVYGHRQIPPEYLLLVDRRHRDDHEL